jgi:hypothetical protein
VPLLLWKEYLFIFIKKEPNFCTFCIFVNKWVKCCMEVRFLSIMVFSMVCFSACVSSDKYNDERQMTAFLKDSLDRAKGRNRQLQLYIDGHIEQYHAGQGLVIPSEMLADTEMRNLKIEINRLRRLIDEKNQVIWDLTKNGNNPNPAINTNTTSVNPPPRPNLNKGNEGDLDNLNVDSTRGMRKRK